MVVGVPASAARALSRDRPCEGVALARRDAKALERSYLSYLLPLAKNSSTTNVRP